MAFTALELELWMISCHCVGAGDWTWHFCRNSKCSLELNQFQFFSAVPVFLLIVRIPSHLLIWGFVCFYCLKVCHCIIYLIALYFVTQEHRAINFDLRNTSILSYWFLNDVVLFSFSSRNFLMFFISRMCSLISTSFCISCWLLALSFCGQIKCKRLFQFPCIYWDFCVLICDDFGEISYEILR